MKLTETQRHKQNECPKCLDAMDAYTGRLGTKPRPLDWSVCLNCGEILRFDEQLDLRLILDEEWEQVHPENKETLLALQRKIRARGLLRPVHPQQ